MNPDLLNPDSYWSKIYTYTEADVQLVKGRVGDTKQRTVNLIVLSQTRLNEELRLLMALESIGRSISSRECIKPLNAKHGSTSDIGYTIEFKNLVREAIKQSFNFENLDDSCMGRLSGKLFSPYVRAVIAEIYAFRQILPSSCIREVIDDILLNEVVKKVEARFKKCFQKQIRQLKYDVEDQLSSYFNYTSYLIDKHGDLRWVKVSLHANHLEACDSNEKLNLIGALSRDFCTKLKHEECIFNECVGYICSLNTLLNESVHADVILFFSMKKQSCDFKKIQFNAISLWHSNLTGLQSADVVFKCSLNVYQDTEYTNIKKQEAILKLPGIFTKTLVNLVARHKLIGLKNKGNKRVRLVTRGEMPRGYRKGRSCLSSHQL